MAVFKLSLSEVQAHPENYLYVFANEEEYLKYLPFKSRTIIRQKKANQKKMLIQSANHAGIDVNEYYNAVRQGFIDIYGLTPAAILVKLAEGETVAGKDWSDGVYGVGAVTDTFSQKDPAGYTVTVNPETGAFIVNGQESASGAIARKGCPDGYGGFSYVDEKGNTYISSYNKIKKMYVASTYTTADGQSYTAGGSAKLSVNSGDMWEQVLGILDKFTNWLISLFGGGTANLITTKNTALDQFKDGYAIEESQAGFGTWGIALLGAVAAGTLLYGGDLFSGGKKKKK